MVRTHIPYSLPADYFTDELCGVPSEFSFRLVGMLHDMTYINADDVLNTAKADGIDCKQILRGSAYERKMADNV